jgi:hypothetical protein
VQHLSNKKAKRAISAIQISFAQYPFKIHLHPDSKNSMGSGGVSVHGGGGGDPVCDSFPEEIGAVPDRLDVMHRQV